MMASIYLCLDLFYVWCFGIWMILSMPWDASSLDRSARFLPSHVASDVHQVLWAILAVPWLDGNSCEENSGGTPMRKKRHKVTNKVGYDYRKNQWVMMSVKPPYGYTGIPDRDHLEWWLWDCLLEKIAWILFTVYMFFLHSVNPTCIGV